VEVQDALISCHTIQHSSADHLLEAGSDTHSIQASFGHSDMKMTIIDTLVLVRGPSGDRSLVDKL
jgi:site-specific recombinase XerD